MSYDEVDFSSKDFDVQLFLYNAYMHLRKQAYPHCLFGPYQDIYTESIKQAMDIVLNTHGLPRFNAAVIGNNPLKLPTRKRISVEPYGGVDYATWK